MRRENETTSQQEHTQFFHPLYQTTIRYSALISTEAATITLFLQHNERAHESILVRAQPHTSHMSLSRWTFSLGVIPSASFRASFFYCLDKLFRGQTKVPSSSFRLICCLCKVKWKRRDRNQCAVKTQLQSERGKKNFSLFMAQNKTWKTNYSKDLKRSGWGAEARWKTSVNSSPNPYTHFVS